MGSLTCFQTFSQPLPCVSILPRGRSVLQVLDTTPLYTLLWAAQPYKMGTTWYTKLDHIFFGVCGCLSVYLVIYEPSSCKRNIQWVSHSFKLPVPLSEHYTLCTSCQYCNHVPPSRKGVMYFIDPYTLKVWLPHFCYLFTAILGSVGSLLLKFKWYNDGD